MLNDDADTARILLTDENDNLEITPTEAREVVEEESLPWKEGAASHLEVSLNEMSSRLQTELALEKTSPRCHAAPAEGKDSLESGDQGLPRTCSTLIPGLPMDLAQVCLSRVPWICQPKLMSVCKNWAAYLASENIFSFRSRQNLSDSLLLVLSVPVRLGPLRLTVFDAKAATTPECHNPLAVFDYQGKWSWFLRGCRCAVVGPDLFIIGGRHDGLQYATGRSVWRFNFATRKWAEAASMHAARRDFACAAVGNKIYVAGGTDSCHVVPNGRGVRSALKSAEVYDYAQNRWHRLPDLETARVGCLGVAVDNRFYAIGGGTDNGTVEFELFRSAEVLDTSEEPLRWKTIDEMWQSHVMLPRAVAGFDHSMFAVDRDDQTLKSYNERTNEWSDVMPMPSVNTILPRRTGLAERHQAMGGLPGDQLVDFPREGLFWMEPCSRPSHVHHLLRLHESRNRGRNWSGNFEITEDREDESSSITSAKGTAPQREINYKSLGANAYLIIGSGIVQI